MNRSLALAVTAALLSGCGSPLPTFYTLSPEGALPSVSHRSVGIGPVTLAEHLNRRNLVIQTSPNRIEVVQSHRWAGDLDHAVARTLATNLGRRLNTGDVRTYPWQRDSEIDQQVSVDIREFIAGEDGYARIEATWRAYSLPGSRLIATKTFIASEPVEKGDYESVVAALSRLLARLSADIAPSIR